MAWQILGHLVERICTWLSEHGHTRVSLMVHEDNVRAQRAYQRLGFEFDGTSCPYRLDRTRRDLGMQKALTVPSPTCDTHAAH